MTKRHLHCAVVFAVFLLYIFTPFPRCAFAGGPSRQTPESVIGFANHLLAEGDAYRAVTEYQAFIFFFPRNPRIWEAWFYMGRAYRDQGLWDDALTVFRKVALSAPEESPWTNEAALEIGRTLVDAGRQESAATAMEGIARSPRWEGIREQALYMAAWARMDAGDFDGALLTLQEIPSDGPLGIRSSALRDAVTDERGRIQRRSPLIAGTLSAILPGSGHAYIGKPKEALTSFLLNAAFIAGAVIAFQDGYYVSGGLLSLFELSWYFGGITTAVDGARSFNRDREKAWIEDLKNRLGPEANASASKRTMGGLRLTVHF